MREIYPGIHELILGTPEADTPSTQFFRRQPRPLRGIEPRNVPPPFQEEALRFHAGTRGFRVELPLSPDEALYGFGLQLKSLQQTGKKRTLRVNSDPVSDTGDSHAPAPLYFSTRGYGVLFDTARYATFHTGGNALRGNRRHTGQAGTIALTEQELYAASGETHPVIVDIPAARGIRLLLISGPTLRNAVQRYNLFSGGGCLPPEWGLGVWYRACGSCNQEEVRQLAAELRNAGMPCDVLGLEPGWQSHAYSCSLSWSRERFPEHQKLVDDLTADGYKINLWEHVFLHPTSPLAPAMEPYSGDFEVWQGLVPDLTIREAAETYTEYHRRTFTSNRIASFKIDECDNSDFIQSPWSFPECSRFPSGKDGELYHSLLGVAAQYAVEAAHRAEGKRSYGSVRSSHLFAAPCPFVLYSDLYDHRDFLRGVTTAGFSGMLWCPELRHASSVLDYLRRLEAMVLSPQMLLNIWSMPHPPWQQLDRDRNRAGELYDTGKQQFLAAATRRQFELRMRFLPYLYAAFARYHLEGIPPFRAVVMDYPECEELRNADQMWMAGEDLLVIPLTAEEETRKVHLPPGTWFDFHTGAARSGRITVSPAPDELTILVRDGSIIPFADVRQYCRKNCRHRVELRIYGNHPRPAWLFADDGESLCDDPEQFIDTVTADGKLSPLLRRRYECTGIARMTCDA